MSIKFLVLDKLASIGECSLEVLLGIFDIADAMMLTYPEACRKLKRSPSRPEIKLLDREKLQLKMNLSSILSKLKKEGLVSNKKRGIWALTKKGKQKLETLSENYQFKKWEKEIKNQLSKKEQKAKNKDEILIVFDIPEEMKRKREWLRMILRSLNFKPLQKSVWIGDRILPQEFLEAIAELKLLPYLEMLSINRKGTVDIK